MATFAEFTIPTDASPLGTMFTEFPDVTVELEQVIPIGYALVPYFWVKSPNTIGEEQLKAEFKRYSEVTSVKVVDEINGDYLMRVEWGAESRELAKAITESNVTILSGSGSADEWTVEVRADNRSDIAAFKHLVREQGIPIELSKLHAHSSLKGEGEYGLTETQHEALILAYEMGYFDSPRRAALDEIAAELDITRQSLASRLRRGHKRLLRSTLIDSSYFEVSE